MRRSSGQLAAILCGVCGLVSNVWADEHEATRTHSATVTNKIDPDKTFIVLEVEIAADGEVSAVKVIQRSITVEVQTTPDGQDRPQVITRDRTAILPARDWQRTLDRHLGRIRMEFGRKQPMFDIKFVGFVDADRKSEFFNILKQRGFKEEREGCTSYIRPTNPGL